jgi:hypothetical protein
VVVGIETVWIDILENDTQAVDEMVVDFDKLIEGESLADFGKLVATEK